MKLRFSEAILTVAQAEPHGGFDVFCGEDLGACFSRRTSLARNDQELAALTRGPVPSPREVPA
jgi:hypothetical protein